MADVATVNVPERSLFERVARVPSLLNQGVESMVAGTLSLPALVADGYINIYRTARQSMGGQAFEASNMFDRSKATLTDAGRTLDGSKGKVIQAETTTEKGIVFGTELVTGLVGPGALKSLKTLSEGATFAKTATVAKTEAAAANVTATTAPTATTTTAASSKVRLATANEDVLSILAKAKAEGEAVRTGATAAKTADAAGDAAKATASAADDFAKASAAGKSANTAKVTAEATEATSKSLLSTAATAGRYTWTGAKILAAPLAYPKTFWLSASAGHILTGGATSALVWGGYTGLWNLGKEYVPGATAAAAEGLLKLGDGTVGFLGTGAKMGAKGLADYLPAGITPPAVRAALGAVDATDRPARETTQTHDDKGHRTLRDRANEVASGARERVEDMDFMDLPEAGPFRVMIAKQLNMDPAKVTGKELTHKLGELAKDNPYFGIGMAFGAIYGGMGADKNPAQRAMGAVMYGALFGVAFQILGQLYPGLMPGLMKMVGAAPDALAKVPGAIGLNTSSLNGGFKAAAEGTTPAPASVPAQDQPRTAVASKFDQAASGMPPALAPAPELDIDLQRKRPEAANNSAYRMTIGA